LSTAPKAIARKQPRSTVKRGGPPVPAATQKLHKILAQSGLGSRRAMEEWIREGKVTVNGRVATIGARVAPGDQIKVGSRTIRFPGLRTRARVLLYHKPEGEIVTRDDPEGRASVFDKLPALRDGKWLAIGRLDFNTSGLLLFTDSGELANRMMHPRYEIEREYAVRILGQLSAEQMARLKKGITLSDGVAHCLWVEDQGGEGANHWYRLAVREGRNRVVRRMFEALSLTVSRLMRVRFGPVALPPRLRRGHLSELPPPEVKHLQEWLDRPPLDRAADPRD
jgi:23S rRNA pseudouridine2605 synthase